MVAIPKTPLDSSSASEAYHYYHAEAHLLSGHLEHPVKQPIDAIGRVVLEHSRRQSLITQSARETSLEGLITFKSGYTRVSGSHLANKRDLHGRDHSAWVTQSTSVIEGFNALDIITADRVVAQVSTEHPLTRGNVPRVTFLGTRFENLQVAGYPIKVDLDLTICGDRPEDDRSYLEHEGFLRNIRTQIDEFEKDASELLKAMDKKCRERIDEEDAQHPGNGYPKQRCTLVKSIPKIPLPGVETFGNRIFIRDFGTVSLAEVEVGNRPFHGDLPGSKRGTTSAATASNYFTLHMFRMHLGCPTGGKLTGPSATANGNNSGPGHN